MAKVIRLYVAGGHELRIETPTWWGTVDVYFDDVGYGSHKYGTTISGIQAQEWKIPSVDAAYRVHLRGSDIVVRRDEEPIFAFRRESRPFTLRHILSLFRLSG